MNRYYAKLGGPLFKKVLFVNFTFTIHRLQRRRNQRDKQLQTFMKLKFALICLESGWNMSRMKRDADMES